MEAEPLIAGSANLSQITRVELSDIKLKANEGKQDKAENYLNSRFLTQELRNK